MRPGQRGRIPNPFPIAIDSHKESQPPNIDHGAQKCKRSYVCVCYIDYLGLGAVYC